MRQAWRMSAGLAAVAAIALAGAGARSAKAQNAPAAGEEIRNQAVEELKAIKERVLMFAGEMPADKYKWNPGQTLNPPPPDPLADPYGRTVADLYLHIAATNFEHPPMLGAAPAPGFTAKDYETSTTDKAKVIEQLNEAFDYAIAAVSKMSAADLAKTYTVGKRQMTGNEVLFAWLVDLNDYMGQTIAYGRMNGIIGEGAKFHLRKAGE